MCSLCGANTLDVLAGRRTLASMRRLSALTLAALASACLGSARADPPAEVHPPDSAEQDILDQHFCCAETHNKDGKKYGSDCETIAQGDVKACTLAGGAVLYCPGAWDLNTSGTATC